MLAASVLCFGAALFWIARQLFLRFEPRLRELESERLASVEQGLSREFFFVDLPHLKKGIRWGAAVGLILSVVLVSPFPLLIAVVLVRFLPRVSLRILQRRRKKRFDKQLPSALASLSSILKAGHAFERALETLSETQSPPMSQELLLVLKEMRLGITLEEALQNLSGRMPGRDLEIAVRAAAISRKTGSNLAEAFDRVAETVRARADMRDRLAGLTAQGRMQAWVAIAMPVILTATLQVIAPDYLSPLFETGPGRLVLAAAALGMTIGGIWIHNISRADLLE